MASSIPSGQKYVLAEFETGEELVEACRAVREKGFKQLDTHSPYPLHEGDEALGLGRSKVPFIGLLGGLTGMSAGYFMMVWMNAINWPLNVGNRPPHSAPAFIPITFECTVLLASLFIFFGLMALMRFPQPYHPVFDLEAFRSACNDGFWLSVIPPTEDATGLQKELETLGGKNVSVVVEQTS